MLAKRVIEHLELSGSEINETDQVRRRRPLTRWHGWIVYARSPGGLAPPHQLRLCSHRLDGWELVPVA
jgi:hypothetical protein